MPTRNDFVALACLSVAAAGCSRDDPEQGAAPPPIASSRPGVCAGGGGKVSDPVAGSFFPRVAGDYCVDPNGETRAYGEDARGSLDDVCTQQFDGECEVYKSYGLRRVVTLRYVDGRGSPGSVAVTVSRFAADEGAYGFFTKRVIADGDPAEVAPAGLEAGGAAALGSGIAYVWRAAHVAELSYTNELEAPDQLRASAKKALPSLAKALGKGLPGDLSPPSAVRILPKDDRLPLGVRYETLDVLGVAGTGPGAIGYFREGAKRWRVFALERADEESAKDVLKTLKKLDGAKTLKDTAFGVLSVPRQRDERSPKVEWLVARRGQRVFGVGDEELVMRGSARTAELAKKRLSEPEKLDRLEQLIQDEP